MRSFAMSLWPTGAVVRRQTALSSAAPPPYNEEVSRSADGGFGAATTPAPCRRAAHGQRTSPRPTGTAGVRAGVARAPALPLLPAPGAGHPAGRRELHAAPGTHLPAVPP